MNEKQIKTPAAAKPAAKPKKKRKKMSQQRVIQIIALAIIIAFVGGIASTGILYFVKSSQNTGLTQIDKAYFISLAKDYEGKVKADPTDLTSLLGLAGTYQQLGTYVTNSGDAAEGKTYFLKSIDTYRQYKEISGNAATNLQVDYVIAQLLSASGSTADAETLYQQLVSDNKDPVMSRLHYAYYLIETKKDTAAATVLVAEAKKLASTDEEKSNVNDLITQYQLTITE